MMRFVAVLLCVAAFVLMAWAAWASIDREVSFSELDLVALGVHGRPAEASTDGPGRGRLFVMFAWRAHQGGARCVRVRSDVAVGVGGEHARAVRFGGGAWVFDGVVPWPRHRCINEALFEIERPMVAGIVGVSLFDGNGKPALMSARDVMAPATLALTSPQPARRSDRATIEAAPASLTLSSPMITRDGAAAWPVEVDANRASFTVPPQWANGDADVRLSANRAAPVVRCERAPLCEATASPVDDAVPFVVAGVLR